MKIEEIRSHFRYNEWANARFSEVLSKLPPEKLTAHLESSFPSILATFTHLVGAEWVWLRRFLGTSPGSFPSWLETPTLAAVQGKLAEVEAERRDYLASLADADLEREIDYRNLSGKAFRQRLVDLLLHGVNHSTYHRGQLTTLLRQVGATPPSTDLIRYRREVED